MLLHSNSSIVYNSFRNNFISKQTKRSQIGLNCSVHYAKVVVACGINVEIYEWFYIW